MGCQFFAVKWRNQWDEDGGAPRASRQNGNKFEGKTLAKKYIFFEF